MAKLGEGKHHDTVFFTEKINKINTVLITTLNFR